MIKEWLNKMKENKRLELTLKEMMINRNTSERVKEILTYTSNNPIIKEATEDGERGMPADFLHQKNEWWKVMLTRYALAIQYSKGRKVLDTCSGVGWGAYLLDGFAHKTIGIDRDQKAIDLSNKLWKGNNLSFVKGNVTKMPFRSKTFDVVTCMESIEHFTVSHAEQYLKEIRRVLKPEGIVIGSSSFPNLLDEAKKICAKNPHHLTIFTKRQMERQLANHFKTFYVFENRRFFKATR